MSHNAIPAGANRRGIASQGVTVYIHARRIGGIVHHSQGVVLAQESLRVDAAQLDVVDTLT
jgi:hypothetical protein